MDINQLKNIVLSNSKSLNRETYFKKMFPSHYENITNFGFPDSFSFQQKLYHYLNNDMNLEFGICPVCGKRCKFLNLSAGYRHHCSRTCLQHDPNTVQKTKATKLERYGDENYNNLEKHKQTCVEKYNCDNFSKTNEWKELVGKTCSSKYNSNFYTGTQEFKEKSKKSMLEKYGVENYAQTRDYVEKTKETNNLKYGKDFYLQTNECRQTFKEKHDEIELKKINSKKKNKTTNSTKIEQQLSSYFSNNGINFITQYNSPLYPFACDFYLPDYDLYVEIQGTWTHGSHPFNPSNEDDIKKLNVWIEKSKNSQYYKNAIYNWTIRDIKKRETAKENKLNYLEIFSTDFETCLQKIKEAFDTSFIH